jgi:hypothetical protein
VATSASQKQTASVFKTEVILYPKIVGNVFCILFMYNLLNGSRDSSVGKDTGYELDYRGVGVRDPVRSRILSPLRRPDLLFGPPNLLSNG